VARPSMDLGVNEATPLTLRGLPNLLDRQLRDQLSFSV